MTSAERNLPDDLTRRTFLQGAAGATAISAASYRRVLGANDRLGVGFIGYGLIGKRHVLDFKEQPDVRCVAVSDVHRGRLDEARAFLRQSKHTAARAKAIDTKLRKAGLPDIDPFWVRWGAFLERLGADT